VIFVPTSLIPIAAHKELETYGAKWGCFGGGIPTDPSSVRYWIRKARAGGVPAYWYDIGKDDDDD
jgi:hypothetical protein